jgi:hypothetical protein
MHVFGFMCDGHHPFSYMLLVPLCKNKMNLVFLCLPKTIPRPRSYKVHKWVFFLSPSPQISLNVDT